MSVKYEASGDALVWFAGCKREHLQEDVCGEANPRTFWLKNIPYLVSKKCKGPGARLNFTNSRSSRRLGPRGE